MSSSHVPAAQGGGGIATVVGDAASGYKTPAPHPLPFLTLLLAAQIVQTEEEEGHRGEYCEWTAVCSRRRRAQGADATTATEVHIEVIWLAVLDNNPRGSSSAA